MKPLNQYIIPSRAASTSFTSSAIDARQLVSFSIQAAGTTGSLAGTFQVQVSNTPVKDSFRDYDNSHNPAVWTNSGTALTFAQSSTATSQLVPKTDISNVAIRLVFTDTSSGSNTATFTAAIAALGL